MNRYVNKFILSFVTVCVMLSYFLSNSHVFAEVAPGIYDHFIKENIYNADLGDIPGNSFITFTDDFYQLDIATKHEVFDYFLSSFYWVHLYPFNPTDEDRDKTWSYIYFSKYPFYLTDFFDSTKTDNAMYIAFYKDKSMTQSPDDLGFKSNTSGFATKRSLFNPNDFRKSLIYGSGVVSPISKTEILSQKSDKGYEFGGGIYSNFPLYYYSHDGSSKELSNPAPDIGSGMFKVTFKFDPEKFKNVRCLKYPDVTIENGNTLGFDVGDKFSFTWEYGGRSCYVEYGPNADDKIDKIKPWFRDGVYGIDGIFQNGHNRSFVLKEGSGEWYDMIFDFLESLFGGIYNFFKPVIDFFAGIFDFFWNLLVDVFKFIFVPEEGFFEKFFNDSMELINRKLGILIYPFTLVIDVLSRFLNLPNASSSLMIPPINIFDVTVFGGVKYDLLGIINADSRFENLYNIYLSFVDVILIFAVVNLSRRTFSSNFKKGADVS